MGEEERYEFYVLDPLREQASAEVWEGFIRGEYELHWQGDDSFELTKGKKEYIGSMNSGRWSEW